MPNPEQGNVQPSDKEHSTVGANTEDTPGDSAVSSSRDSLAGAGWICEEVGRFVGFVPSEAKPFSWLNPVPLWWSRNQVLGALLGDPTNDERRRWMAIQRTTVFCERAFLTGSVPQEEGSGSLAASTLVSCLRS